MVTRLLLSPQSTVRLYPFQIHSIALSSFASIVGPFGGFFASGFKRAFKIKVPFYCIIQRSSRMVSSVLPC